MNLPSNIITAGKAALQANWSDTVTVTRKGNKKVGNSYPMVTAYQDIKCHFSQGSQPVLDQTSTVATTKSIFMLFVDPSVELKSGDSLTVHHKGQTFEGAAGEPFNRDFSNSVKVEVNKVS